MTSPRGTKQLARKALPAFMQGLSYPLDGWRFIRGNRLWALVALPIAVNVLLFVLLTALTVWLVLPWLAGLNEALAPEVQEGIWGALLGFLGGVLKWLIWIAAPIVILVVHSFLLLMIGQAVAGPFLDILSEKVETLVTNKGGEPTNLSTIARSLVVSLADLLWSLLYWAAFNLPLTLVSLLVPGIGSTLAAAASFVFTALLVAQEFVGLSAARHFVSYRDRWSTIWSNRAVALGFGSATMLLLVVPLLNLILLPLAAVGGTLLYCDLEGAGRLAKRSASAHPASARVL